MNLSKNFEEFLLNGTILQRASNKNRADSIFNEAKLKKVFLEKVIKYVPEQDIYSNFVIDFCYDIILEFVRAKMYFDGFSADSHEAEVSYMIKLNFSRKDVLFMNALRYFRNGTKYYGKINNKDYADNVLLFLNRLYPKLKRLEQ